MERVGEGAPRPPRQRRAFSVLGGPVETSGDATAARALAGLFRADAALARALTHGFHSYAGRMHPSMARAAIQRWSRRGELVLDPFCGSGTVLVEAYGLGRPAVGVDASPLAILVARVRSTTLGDAGRARLVEQAAVIAEEAAERARKRKRPEIPPWARDEAKRFAPHVALELLGLRELVMRTAEDDVGRALRACLSSLLVKFMSAGPQAPRDAAGKRIGRTVPSRFFAGRARELAEGLEALERRAPEGTAAPRCSLGDARALRGVRDGSVTLVLSSPPYAGTYDYARHHDVRFAWLGLPMDRFEDVQIGARQSGLGADPRRWRESRRRWVAELGRVLGPTGHAVLVVGDGVVGETPEDAVVELARDAEASKLAVVAVASQRRPILDRRVREIFGPRPRREHVVLLRR